MHRDVYPDGAHHELTPGYHSWVMERFLKAALLAKVNGYDAPGLLDRHEKMFEFLMKISKPDRHFPPLGDAGGTAGGNIAGWMGLGALLYDRPDMRYLAVDHVLADWVWRFGPGVVERYAALEARPPDFESCLLPEAKYCMMRTGWEKSDRYMLFDCAPWGGGHSHQDRLQVIVYAGRDLLVDPGQFSYDQPLSARYFRRTAAHNVVMIDGQEQLDSDPQLLTWFTSDLVDFAAGEIHAHGLRHQRSVLFLRPDYWIVVDHVFGEGEHEVKRLFHFPGQQVQFEPDQAAARTIFRQGENIWVKAADGAQLVQEEGWLPTGSATAEKAPVAAFVAHARLPVPMVTVLVPFEESAQLPKVERFDAGHPLTAGIRVTFPDGQRDEIAIADEVRDLRIGARRARARALVRRSGPQAEGMAVVDGSPRQGAE
ncbi:MAG: alginate lyase family protein [Armatimonadetes bacterium]|nr:alginate lyase family protein [Armatimonadota bacterium]